MALQYKFIEVSPVTDDALEACVNEWVAHGWQLDGIRFVTTEHSKRPTMAFVSFTRAVAQATADLEPPREPPPLVTAYELDDEDQPAVIVAIHADDVE